MNSEQGVFDPTGDTLLKHLNWAIAVGGKEEVKGVGKIVTKKTRLGDIVVQAYDDGDGREAKFVVRGEQPFLGLRPVFARALGIDIRPGRIVSVQTKPGRNKPWEKRQISTNDTEKILSKLAVLGDDSRGGQPLPEENFDQIINTAFSIDHKNN